MRTLLTAGAGVTGSANRWGHTPLDVARALPVNAEANDVRAALGLPPASNRNGQRKNNKNLTRSDGEHESEDGHLLGFLASIASDESAAIS